MKQISVFLQNKNGELADLLELLASQTIDLRALSLADTQDYGILRMIADKHDQASELLRREGYAFSITDVVGVPMKNEAGSLSRVTRVCAEQGISIEYAYAFFTDQPGLACVILRTDDSARTQRILAEHGIETATQEELFR